MVLLTVFLVDRNLIGNERGMSMTENEKTKYEIILEGCDDDTFFIMELTEQEYELLVRVSEVANATSTYGCMPRLFIRKCDE